MMTITSIAYRLEKRFDEPYGTVYDVYNFHQTFRGQRYIRHHEESDDRSVGAIYPTDMIYDAKKGNDFYKHLKKQGYKFVGIFECDTCGEYRLKTN